MNLVIFFGDFTLWNTELIILSVKALSVLNSTLFSKFKEIYITAIEIHNNQEKIAIFSLLVNLKKIRYITENQCYVPAKRSQHINTTYPNIVG